MQRLDGPGGIGQIIGALPFYQRYDVEAARSGNLLEILVVDETGLLVQHGMSPNDDGAQVFQCGRRHGEAVNAIDGAIGGWRNRISHGHIHFVGIANVGNTNGY